MPAVEDTYSGFNFTHSALSYNAWLAAGDQREMVTYMMFVCSDVCARGVGGHSNVYRHTRFLSYVRCDCSGNNGKKNNSDVMKPYFNPTHAPYLV